MPPDSNSPEVRVLLVFREEALLKQSTAILESLYPKHLSITHRPLLQEGVEVLENTTTPFQLVIFDHYSASQSIVKMFLNMGTGSHFILVSNDKTILQSYPTMGSIYLDAAADYGTSLEKELGRLIEASKIPIAQKASEEVYVAMPIQAILASKPLRMDVYVKLGEGRYVRFLRKGDEAEPEQIKRYQEKNAEGLFYVRKSDCEILLRQRADAINEAAKKVPITKSDNAKQFNSSYNLVKDVVKQVGFTQEAQNIAKNSVAMTLKAIGTRPQLTSILQELRKKDGNYTVSHSLMLGQVACAIAHKIGWHSSSTFFKLSLAAFMHDIALNDSRLAQVTSLEVAKSAGGYSDEELNIIKTHPGRAAEYSQQFSEIPPDVDQIIMQHHESPDGKGFPRELGAKFISPLAALFIIAHEMVDCFMDEPEATVESFLLQNQSRYNAGQFKKIVSALLDLDIRD